MAEKVRPTTLAVAQGEYRHGERDGLAANAQLDLIPVKLTLLSWFIILFDEDFPWLFCLLLFALLYVLAYAGIADVEPLLYQASVYVLTLQALLAHTGLPALGVLCQPVLYLCTNLFGEPCALNSASGILWPACKAQVYTFLRI